MESEGRESGKWAHSWVAILAGRSFADIPRHAICRRKEHSGDRPRSFHTRCTEFAIIDLLCCAKRSLGEPFVLEQEPSRGGVFGEGEAAADRIDAGSDPSSARAKVTYPVLALEVLL